VIYGNLRVIGEKGQVTEANYLLAFRNPCANALWSRRLPGGGIGVLPTRRLAAVSYLRRSFLTKARAIVVG
jgi:hypothetical protein